MLKYHSTFIGFREVPDEISLCINISGCKNNCKGCHSAFLQEDIGTSLSRKSLSKLIQDNEGVTCVAFMGGDHITNRIIDLAHFIKCEFKNLKVAWYSGRNKLPESICICKFLFDYIKIGRYEESLGPLDSPTTNQKMFKVDHDNDDLLIDITYKFKKHYETKNSN